ncbi:cellulase family glycosylhydrolase [Rhodococcus ruber]|uniref:Cellulase family glycosylhydrolase n=1 Tax=Rhodococcus ruber TaxID=1830 RepID=A0ABT4MAU6_9NOCA|nr:cellulase family glycosylhydrolase [Rhodococcus ruber]MCZ4518082.1 cellulase family glycosylhydrolase [Rhodococcus ruber]
MTTSCTAAVLVSALLAGCSQGEQSAPEADRNSTDSGTTATSTSAAPADQVSGCAPEVSDLGITAVSASFSDQQLDQQSSLISDYGFGSVRLTIHWPIIEPSPGVFDWTSTDQQVDAFASKGIDILGVATWAPAWDVDPANRTVPNPAPTSPSKFAEFARLAAERYKDRIRTWEIWNEPNVAASFGPAEDLSTYVPMLKESYEKIKSVDPQLLVLTGGTSPTVNTDSDLNPFTFLQGLYDRGAAPYFDAVAMHPYSAPKRLSEPSAERGNSNTAINLVREVMVANGDRDKQIWFTEFGAASGTGPRSVSEPDQAALLVDGIDYLRSLPYCGGIYLFDLRDIDTGSAVDEYNAGLVRSDFSPKPALNAVTTLR